MQLRIIPRRHERHASHAVLLHVGNAVRLCVEDVIIAGKRARDLGTVRHEAHIGIVIDRRDSTLTRCIENVCRDVIALEDKKCVGPEKIHRANSMIRQLANHCLPENLSYRSRRERLPLDRDEMGLVDDVHRLAKPSQRCKRCARVRPEPGFTDT